MIYCSTLWRLMVARVRDGCMGEYGIAQSSVMTNTSRRRSFKVEVNLEWRLTGDQPGLYLLPRIPKAVRAPEGDAYEYNKLNTLRRAPKDLTMSRKVVWQQDGVVSGLRPELVPPPLRRPSFWLLSLPLHSPCPLRGTLYSPTDVPCAALIST